MPKKRLKKRVKGTSGKKVAKKPKKKAAARRKPAARAGKKPPAKVRLTKAIDFRKLSLRQAIARLCEHFVEADYDSVLAGSACAAIYVGPSLKPKVVNFFIGEYTTADLDRTMAEIGFARSSMNHYESDAAPFDIVFLPPPLAVGDDVVRDVTTAQARPGKFQLLSATDCVRQRLSMFYRWGDRDAFYEAVEVAKKQKIDMELVKRWSEWEWCTDKYEEFIKELEGEIKL